MMQQLSARYSGIIVYELRNSADLELNAALRGATFTDADLKAFLPLRERIVLIDLSGNRNYRCFSADPGPDDSFADLTADQYQNR